jgi:hypothetical protein
MTRCCCLGVALLLHALAHDVDAQQVRGQLIDAASKRPIQTGAVILYHADSSVSARAVSDSAGRWLLAASRPGSYFISVRRLGYQPWVSGALKLEAGKELTTVVELRVVPVQLDPITARAAAVRRQLEYSGFFERQRSNFGHFLTPEAIENRQAARVTDLLSAIPGVQLVVGGSGSAGPTHVGLRGSSVTDGALCRPRVFVDGLMYARGDSRAARVQESNATERADLDQRMDQALSLDDIGHPTTIAGIEVYRSASQVPVQFGGTSVETLCGVIVIWTHTGRIRTPRR